MTMRLVASLVVTVFLVALVPTLKSASVLAQEDTGRYVFSMTCQGPDPENNLIGEALVEFPGSGTFFVLVCTGTNRSDSAEAACENGCLSTDYLILATIDGHDGSGTCDFLANGHNTFHCNTNSGTNSLVIKVSASGF